MMSLKLGSYFSLNQQDVVDLLTNILASNQQPSERDDETGFEPETITTRYSLTNVLPTTNVTPVFLYLYDIMTVL